MSHQIIDNRDKKLSEEINQQLEYTNEARIAVGYFFLSGLQSIQDRLSVKNEDGQYKIKEVRLLIGNTSNKKTIEEIAKSYHHKKIISKKFDEQQYPRSSDKQREVKKAQEDVQELLADIEPEDTNEDLLKLIRDMIKEDRLKIKVYVKAKLHAKAYIFDFINPQPQSKGIGIVGSSNLSLAGLTNNTELNVYVHDNGKNHAALKKWFKRLWDESEDFDEALLNEIEESWAVKPAKPYDIYMKTIYTLVKDRLDIEEKDKFLWKNKINDMLADFQRVAVLKLIGIIKQYGGAFAADVVGMGKSFVGAAVIKHFRITENAKPLIICPKTLEDMWCNYNARFSLNAEIVPMSILREGDPESDDWNFLVSDVKYRDRDFVLVDESHHFRHHNPQRYRILQDFLQTGYKNVLLLTATPRNNSAMDVYHQIKLFHPRDITSIPIDPPNLKDYFKKIVSDETGREESKNLFKLLLQHILVRRTRMNILKWYGYDSETDKRVDPHNFEDYISGDKRAYILVDGKKRFFPVREVSTVQYSIADTYQGLYQKIRTYLGKAEFDYSEDPNPGELTYARYAIWHYVDPEKQDKRPYNELKRAGRNLRGLMRILLFKRFESSVYAFRMTINRLIKIQEAFLLSLENDIVPAGDDAQKILYGSDNYSEEDLIRELSQVTGKYNINDFDIERLKTHIKHDLKLFKEILEIVNKDRIPPEKDAKLQKLKQILDQKPLSQGKVLIFSESAETVDYLYKNLNPGENPAIRKASTGNENKTSLVNKFAPVANDYTFKRNETEIRMLISTDVLSEGLNLHDCDKMINYDLHWNPVKLIQRFGRIDRIGSQNDVVYGFNFLPDTELERNLSLHDVVSTRIQEIHDTIGEDAEILDSNEEVNQEAMYAIYEEDVKKIALFEEDDDSMTLNEAEEILRQMREENPEEFDRIANLRDGIRSSANPDGDQYFVFCQAGSKNTFNQLFLVDKNGEIISRDITEILSKIKCSPDQSRYSLPDNYNKTVRRIKKKFEEEVEQRSIEQKHSYRFTTAQKYIIDELKILYKNATEDNIKQQINTLEFAVRNVDRTAVKREFSRIKRHKMTGEALLKRLIEIYTRHNLNEIVNKNNDNSDEVVVSRIICSEVI